MTRTELLLRKRHARLYMTRPNFSVDMGFGLHHGWAIEGAIGSKHKVDVSYLSPHVNMSARLEVCCKPFHRCAERAVSFAQERASAGCDEAVWRAADDLRVLCQAALSAGPGALPQAGAYSSPA